MNTMTQQYTKVLSESIKRQYSKKDEPIDGYLAVCECIDQDTLTIEDQDGIKEIPVIKRPISQLDEFDPKSSAKIASDSTAKDKPDPVPPVNTKTVKGIAAGAGE